jgi:hypothetical protein
MVVPTVTLPKKAPPRKDYWLTRFEVALRIRMARKSVQTRHIARALDRGLLGNACAGYRRLPSGGSTLREVRCTGPEPKKSPPRKDYWLIGV